jgi:hypothetical protein
MRKNALRSALVFSHRGELLLVQDLPLTASTEPFSDRRNKGMPHFVLLFSALQLLIL